MRYSVPALRLNRQEISCTSLVEKPLYQGRYLRSIAYFKLAFLDGRSYSASRVLQNAYDRVRYLSSKGKNASQSSIARLWLSFVGYSECSGKSVLGVD